MTENMSLQACTRYARVLDTHHYVEQLLKRLNVQRVKRRRSVRTRTLVSLRGIRTMYHGPSPVYMEEQVIQLVVKDNKNGEQSNENDGRN